MAALPMRAAEPAGLVPAGPVLDERETVARRTTFIVRADPHTGRLVRSAVVRSELARDAALLKSPLLSSKPASKPSKEVSGPVDRIGLIGLINQTARAHQVDPLLVHSIIKVESNYNSYAVSNKGAEGLMQLMPPTARMLGVSNSFDPQQNIEAGVKYLKYLQGVYQDDRLALAAYNAGPAAVEKYKQVPPYKETQNYVEQVGKRYADARRAAADSADKVDQADQVDKAGTAVRVAGNDAEKAAAGQALARLAASPPLEQHPKLEQFVDEHGRLSRRTVE